MVDHRRERSTELRDAGQNIDVRGAGREVLRRMGLEDAVRAAGTGEVGTQFVGDDGEVIASFDAGENDTDGATAELEILRGELAGCCTSARATPPSTSSATRSRASTSTPTASPPPSGTGHRGRSTSSSSRRA